MKKTILSVVFFTCIFMFSSCSQADDIKDTLDALSCAKELQRLQDDNDLSCSETITALKKIKKSCGDSAESIQEYIDLLEGNCEDD